MGQQAEARKASLLTLSPGRPVPLLGNHAIVRGALEAGVGFVTGYPGTPASEIGDAFMALAGEAGVACEYSMNEKVALETAFGAALAGVRALVSMKHLGFSYALDPAATIPYVGVEAGLVVVSAGDPSARTSPNEQDQRHFASFLYYPVLDPATPADAHRMAREAFALSEAARLPVLLRPVTRVCHTSALVTPGPLPEERPAARYRKAPPRHVPIPENARRMRKELLARWARATAWLAASPFFEVTGEGKAGVAAAGPAWTYVHDLVAELDAWDRVRVLKVGAYPVPEAILARFLEEVERVLVVEELTPFLEDEVVRAAYRLGRRLPVLGKRTGHFPEPFEYTPDLVEARLRAYLGLPPRTFPPHAVRRRHLPPRPPVLCPGCPHRASFHLVRQVFGRRTVYVNDIGCYTLGYGEPLETCDVLLCMGASISMASGIARATGRRVVAFIGDSTFFHSGLPALAGAVEEGAAVTVVVLDNQVTAMTGFQPSPTNPAPGKPALDAARVARALGVTEVWVLDPFDPEGALPAVRAAACGAGVKVIVFRAPCALEAARRGTKRPALEILAERCNACSLCVRLLGCPGILVENGRFVIDRRLCTGCELCLHVCRTGAIVREDGGEA